MVDILIVGGGLTGAALMLALKGLGYSTLLVEAKPLSDRIDADFDARTLALSPASVRILQMLKVWPLIQAHATPIDTIHVSERGAFGKACLKRDDKQPLGHVVEMQYINRALVQLLDQHEITAPAKVIALDYTTATATISSDQGISEIKARLIVAADGAQSPVRALCGLSTRTKHYDQHALVANIGLARAHQHHAYERFTPSGPLALLPLTGLRASLVWALKPADAQKLSISSDADFLHALQQAFGYRLGRFVKVGKRVIYPLEQSVMQQDVIGSVVFVGNAAHTLHPVAGQGFNLGLRDIATLAQCIAKEGLGLSMLNLYQQSRSHDQAAIIRFTDSLIELFTSRIPCLSTVRGMGLMALDNTPFLKNLIARYARGFAGVTPDLVCGIPLGNINESI